jgi:hypothetical protein
MACGGHDDSKKNADLADYGLIGNWADDHKAS